MGCLKLIQVAKGRGEADTVPQNKLQADLGFAAKTPLTGIINPLQGNP
jgi:hypothetical protein